MKTITAPVSAAFRKYIYRPVDELVVNTLYIPAGVIANNLQRDRSGRDDYIGNMRHYGQGIAHFPGSPLKINWFSFWKTNFIYPTLSDKNSSIGKTQG